MNRETNPYKYIKNSLLNLVMSTSSPSSSMICHQRALSLPQNSNLIVNSNSNKYEQNAQSQSSSFASNVSSCSSKASNNNNNNSNIAAKTFAIQPVHHRTRSLPLTEETAIDFTSQSPPNFSKFSPLPSVSAYSSSYTTASGTVIDSRQNNNSMESIIEDYQNMDVVNNNSTSYRANNGGSSILKQLSKIANSNLASHNCNAMTGSVATSSPSQLRKKRQHHNVMTASSLRSTYNNQK